MTEYQKHRWNQWWKRWEVLVSMLGFFILFFVALILEDSGII